MKIIGVLLPPLKMCVKIVHNVNIQKRKETAMAIKKIFKPTNVQSYFQLR